MGDRIFLRLAVALLVHTRDLLDYLFVALNTGAEGQDQSCVGLVG